jgi:hypothetical protein
MDRTITTVDPDQDGAFTIRFAECNHETTGVSSPVACGLGKATASPVANAPVRRGNSWARSTRPFGNRRRCYGRTTLSRFS